MNRRQRRAAKSRGMPGRRPAPSVELAEDLPGLFAQAVRHHQADRLAEAEIQRLQMQR
jgi:hypothetical protein